MPWAGNILLQPTSVAQDAIPIPGMVLAVTPSAGMMTTDE